jgi:hypothetical protein
MMQSPRLVIGLLVILIVAAIASGADQRIVATLIRTLEWFLLLLTCVEVVVRSLRLQLAFQKGWVIRKGGGKDLVRRAEQPQRFWRWTAIEGAYLLAATALLAFWVWLLTLGSN